MSDLRQNFLDGMSSVAATVSVVTTDGPGGRAGVTVSATSSVSADTEKPVLLVCVNDNSSGSAPILENGVFTVNILRDDQSFVSDTFAGRYGDKGEAKFACAKWSKGATGTPVLKGALASFDCKIIEDRFVGQHHVLFGEVQQVHLSEAGRSLVYANRSYGAAFRLPPAADSKSGGERLKVACLSSFAAFHLPGLLLQLRENFPGLEIEILEGDQAQVAHLVEAGEAELGLLYDCDVPDPLQVEALKQQVPYALFAADDPLAKADAVSLEDLADEPLIMLDQQVSRDYVLGLFAAIDREPNIVMRTSSFEMARSLVGNGLGCSVLITKPGADISYDGKPLAARPFKDNLASMSLALVRPKEGDMTQAATQFHSGCVDYFNA